ncbi:50S ribosomal protein L23 [Cysteiniphilum halobium]|uniref:50S ribosomal protein L23 n=1 Tax=Cysteiniphilum halobium TaxID=2219059 RepID=UPI000E65730D|nr:50S ribosomal protein L23 [Cysteiniphilum halobium]
MNQERLLKVLLSPHVTNKAYEVAERSSYVVFKVATDATKKEIKKAVEMLFEVQVEDVKTVNVKGKARRFGRIEGRTKDWKKAYIRLQEGHDINFIGAE